MSSAFHRCIGEAIIAYACASAATAFYPQVQIQLILHIRSRLDLAQTYVFSRARCRTMPQITRINAVVSFLVWVISQDSCEMTGESLRQQR